MVRYWPAALIIGFVVTPFEAQFPFRSAGSQTITVVEQEWQDDKHSYTRDELRAIVQRKQHELMGFIITSDASQLSGNAGYLANLELDPEQHRELGRAIKKRREECMQKLLDFQEEARLAETERQKAEIQDRAYREIAEMAESALEEFKAALLPHQTEKLEELLTQVRFQSVIQICQQYSVPFEEVCAITLDLDSSEEQKFTNAVKDALAQYEQRIQRAKDELRTDLRNAAPTSQRDEWTQMLGEDPSPLAEVLRVMSQ